MYTQRLAQRTSSHRKSAQMQHLGAEVEVYSVISTLGCAEERVLYLSLTRLIHAEINPAQ